MNYTKKIGFFLSLNVLFMFALSAFAAPTISDLKVTPIEPLGLAIDYNVSGAETVDDLGWTWGLNVSMSVGETTYTAKTLTGETECENGAHRVYWNVAKDEISFGKTNMNVTVTYKYGLARYCVIDLSGGASATSYSVTYLNSEPKGGFNTTEYKTTKLVMQCVDAGTFIMGSDQTNESHRVTLTKPFYMGLYEVTQKQWELVMGSNPSDFTGEANPVESVSYDDIRGSSDGANWPATNLVDSASFLGKLRRRTGIDFDLPTEAQWEYTCRAGTTTTYSYGSSANGDYMWYDDQSSASHTVGTKKANPWGFYDMHGNVSEWCLDWFDTSYYWHDTLSYGTDPKGSSSGSYRVHRGGSWFNFASYCTSSYRNYSYPSYSGGIYGFRLSRTLP